MDRIRIRGLRVETHIGVPAEERARPQAVLIDADMYADLSPPGRSDALEDTVDYGATVAAVAELVRSRPRNLLEHLAEEVASFLLDREGVKGVSVEVAKESPPMAEDIGKVSVTIERGTR